MGPELEEKRVVTTGFVLQALRRLESHKEQLEMTMHSSHHYRNKGSHVGTYGTYPSFVHRSQVLMVKYRSPFTGYWVASPQALVRLAGPSMLNNDFSFFACASWQCPNVSMTVFRNVRHWQLQSAAPFFRNTFRFFGGGGISTGHGGSYGFRNMCSSTQRPGVPRRLSLRATRKTMHCTSSSG